MGRHARGLGLCLQREAADGERVGLGDRALRSRRHVRNEVTEVPQRLSARIDMARALAVHEEDVVGAGASGDVDVFA